MDLIKTTQAENGDIIVSGRELHEFLEVKEKYTQWFERMVSYGFSENVDFIVLNELSEKKEGSRIVKRAITNHVIKLDMAKEISMIQRTEKGKQARQYFIEIEKRYKQPVNNLELALRAALEHEVAIKEIKEDVEELKDNLVVTSSQAKAINKKVSERVYAALGGENAPAFKELKNKVFKACWRDFKDLFDISEYRELPRIKFGLGMQFLCDWEPNATLKFEIKQLNNQGTLF